MKQFHSQIRQHVVNRIFSKIHTQYISTVSHNVDIIAGVVLWNNIVTQVKTQTGALIVDNIKK